jgi:adenosine deaminase
VALKIVERVEDHPIKEMMGLGLLVSVNSDDPSYFGGYVLDNYSAIAGVFGLSSVDLADLARNSIQSSFLDAERKRELTAEVDAVLSGYED